MKISLIHKKFGEMPVLIDDADWCKISHLRLYVQKGTRTFYVAWHSLETKKGGQIHRLLMDAAKGYEVDHINGNGLDNRKNNLRIGTHQQNAFNRGSSKNLYSKFKGVTWKVDRKKWHVHLMVNGKTIYGGSFKCEINAALKYNELAKQYHGEFALLNVFTDEELNKKIDERIPKRGENTNNTSGYRGVVNDKKCNRWVAQITIKRKNIVLGRFDKKEDAAVVYLNKFEEVHGYRPYKVEVV